MRGAARACFLAGGIVALAALAWMALLPGAVEHELRRATGFDFRIAVLAANPFTGRVVIRGLTASNPAGYPKPGFIEMRELRAEVEVFSWFFSPRIVVDDLDLDIREIVLIRRSDGRTNAGDFMAAFSHVPGTREAAGSPAPPKPTPYLVKHMRLRFDRLVVADYSGSKTDEKTYDLHLDQTYEDISDPRGILVPSVVRNLRSLGLRSDIAGVLPGDFGKAVAVAVGGVAQIGAEVKDAGKRAGDYLKGLLDKLEQSQKQ